MHFTLITFFINSAERSRVLNQYVDIAIMLVVGFYVCWYSLNIGLSQQKFCVDSAAINIKCLRRNRRVKSPRKTRQGRHQVRCQASEDDKMGPTFSSWTRSHQLLDTGSSTNREHLQVNVWNNFIWSASYYIFSWAHLSQRSPSLLLMLPDIKLPMRQKCARCQRGNRVYK